MLYLVLDLADPWLFQMTLNLNEQHTIIGIYEYYYFALQYRGTGSAQISPETKAGQNQQGLICARSC